MTSNASTVKREVISLGTAKAERGPEIDMTEEADLGLQEGIEEWVKGGNQYRKRFLCLRAQ